MKKILLKSDINSPDGYSYAARNVIAALKDVTDLKILNEKRGPMNIPILNEIAQEYSALSNKPINEFDICIQISKPEFFEPHANTPTTGWFDPDTNKLTDDQVGKINQMTSIWTSSEENREALNSSGVTVPIFLIPFPINYEAMATISGELPIAEITHNIFGELIPRQNRLPVIGMISRWDARKDIQSFLIAVSSAFNQDECIILLKTYQNAMDSREEFQIKQLVSGLKSKFPSAPKVVLITEMLADEQIAMLYNSIDIYCSTARREAIGMDIMQAIAKPIPVVIPDVSLPKLNHVNRVPTLKMPVYDFGEYISDRHWSQIGITELGVALKTKVEHASQHTIPTDEVLSAQRSLLEFHSINNATIQIMSGVESVERIYRKALKQIA